MSDQWKWLVGGKITAVEERPDVDGWNPNETMLQLTVEFPKPRTVKDYGNSHKNCTAVKLEVWQDEEGNGAGELVLVETLQLVPQ